MKSRKCQLQDHKHEFTPYNYADCYTISVNGKVNAEQAARYALEKSPKWVDDLMALRNFIVKPFGIAIDASNLPKGTKTIGMFPIVKVSETQIVLGFDDIHLDFRIVVDAKFENGKTDIFATTYVQTHNLLGKAYLFTIKPFHKIIVRQAVSNILNFA